MKKCKINKIFSIICLLLVSCLVFSGCASVHYSVLVNTDGSVQQGFQVSLDKNKITMAGYNYSDVANKVETIFQNSVNNNSKNIANYCLANGKSIFNCGIATQYERVDEQNFYAYIAFENIATYTNYSKFLSGGSSGSEADDNSNLQENPFFIKDIEVNDTVYSGLDEKDADGNYTNQIVKAFTDYFDGSTEGTQKFTLDDVEYNFYYGLPTTKLHSNSDKVISQSGVQIHQWVFNSSNLNEPIQTWTIQIKPVAWYVLALVLTFILILILFIICLIKKKYKKSRKYIKKIENTIAHEEIS